MLASRSGAAVPGLLDLVLASGDTLAARYYVGSGRRQAQDLLCVAPEMAIHVAYEALRTAPDVIIPSLLSLAEGDTRELHNTPEQPLRLIKDWANSDTVEIEGAVDRKRTVIATALKWAADGNDFTTACRACAEVLRTSFESNEMDPGAGMTIHLMSGMLTDEEIEQLHPLWAQLRDAIRLEQRIPWPSLLSLCWSLVHPSLFGSHPAEAFEGSRRFSETAIADVAELASDHPAILERLNTLRSHLGLEETYSVPYDYGVLLGDRDSVDWQRDEEERSTQIAALSEEWAADEPGAFAARLKWLQDEASLAGRTGYDRSPRLCHLVAQKIADPGSWLVAVSDAGLSPACLLPFLDRAVQEAATGWEDLVLPMLNDPSTEVSAIDVALRAPGVSDRLWSALASKLPRYGQYIDTLCLRRQVSEDTLRRLLKHDSADVTHATSVGMWTGETHGDIPETLREDWEAAVVAIDDDEYWLGEILASSPGVAARWLRARIEHDDWAALWELKNVEAACQSLDPAARLDLLRDLPERFVGDVVGAALVGDSDALYRQVVADGSLGDRWEDPLRRSPDDLWRRRAEIALDEGKALRDVASASMLRSDGWSGPHSAHLQSKIDDYSRWLDDPDARIREVAKQAIAWFEADRERALADERREAIEGLR